MAQGDGIRVNGNQHSWGSLVFKLGPGVKFHGVRSIGYGDKRTRTKTYGMGRHQAPRGRSRGKYEVDPVKLACPVGTAEALRAMIEELAGTPDIGNFEFEGTLQYIENEGTSSEVPMTVEFRRLVLVADTVNHEESADELREEIELDCMAIIRNGRTLFDREDGEAPA